MATVMQDDLQKLRIGKERRVWPWVLLLVLLGGAGAASYVYLPGAAAVPVQAQRVKAPVEGTKGNDLVSLQATGYIMAAHKIALASKVVGRVAWIGVEMGDKVKKDDVLVRLE